MSEQPQVLARISGSQFYGRPESYRREVRSWLHANDIDPNDVAVADDLHVVLGDCPLIEYPHWLRDCNGGLMGPEPTLVTRHSLLRVPLPAHLNDGTYP